MPSVEVLYKIRKQRPDIFAKTEGTSPSGLPLFVLMALIQMFIVYLDGGVRRGTDVLKALCLGATAVGLGRPFLYAQSVSLLSFRVFHSSLLEQYWKNWH